MTKAINIKGHLQSKMNEMILNPLYMDLYYSCEQGVYSQTASLVFNPLYVALQTNLLHKLQFELEKVKDV